MKKVWLNRYPANVPAEINADRYTSLIELFEQAAGRFVNKPAYINRGQWLTFCELDKQSRDFAAYLQSGLGLKQGDRVALMMPNLLQYPVALFGALRAGMVIVNINPLYTPRELKQQLIDSGAITLVLITHFAVTLQSIIAETSVKHVILTQAGDQLPKLRGALLNFAVKFIKRRVPAYHLPGAVFFRQVMRIGAHLPYRRPKVENNDLAFLQYSGGTTGVAKGAMLTHRNMQANLEQVKATYGSLLHEGKEMVVTALPLYHAFALTMNCLLFIELGGCNLLITNPRDIPGMVNEIRRYPFTAITGVNTLFNALLNNEAFNKLDFTALRLSAGGGMAIQKAVAERWEALTGTYLLEGYGMTECSPLVSVNPWNTACFNGSIGVPVPSTEIKLIDDQGDEVAEGQPGELCIRGPQVMSGYWQQRQATEDVLKDGWLRSGDIVTMDDQGYLRIVDRKKDIILVSGFNVYPNEIEDILMQHEKIQEAAAVGVPSAYSGETVKVFLVKKDPSLTREEVLDHCRGLLTGYKMPKIIEFCDELPKSNVGKILRRLLRQEAIEAAVTRTGPLSVRKYTDLASTVSEIKKDVCNPL